MSFYHLEMANSYPIVKCFIKSCPYLLQARESSTKKKPQRIPGREDEPSGQSSRGKLNLNRKKGTASVTAADWVSEPFDAVLVRLGGKDCTN